MSSRVRDFKLGLHFHFPLCCVIRYCLSSGDQAVHRGIVGPHGPNPYVPCNIFHHGVDYFAVTLESLGLCLTCWRPFELCEGCGQS